MFSPGVSRGSLSWVSLHRGGRLVASVSSELGAAQSVLSVLSLHHILAFVRCELRVPPCFLAYCGAPWLMALRCGLCRIPAGLESMDRPLLVSSVESQLCECPFMVLPRQLVGSGVYSPASPIFLLLAL